MIRLPRKNKPNYRLGDRVVGNDKGWAFHKVKGTILYYDESDKTYAVEFDQQVGSSSCGHRCEYGYGMWLTSERIRPAKKSKDEVSERELMKIINKK